MATIYAQQALDMAAPISLELSDETLVNVEYSTHTEWRPAYQVLIGWALLFTDPYTLVPVEVRDGISSIQYQDGDHAVSVQPLGTVPLDEHPNGISGYSVSSVPGTGVEFEVSGVNIPVTAWPYTLNTFTPGRLAGDDIIYGSSSPDTLLGYRGNDQIYSGYGGGDTLAGGSGDDAYFVDGPGTTIVEYGGQGRDTVEVRFDEYPAAGAYTLPANVENLVLFPSVQLGGVGNNAGNVLTGNALANALSGLGGADLLRGGAGNDTLYGGAGADTLNGGSGADTLAGNGGDDTLIWNGADAGLNGGIGTDTLKLTGGNLDLTAVINTKILEVEQIDLAGGGNNTLTVGQLDVLAISSTTDTLRVFGDAGDTVIAAGFTDFGVSGAFHQYQRGALATLLVDTDVNVVI